ncbi:MAG: hypothetical protein R3C10_11840 [Pirellulales bacterium]
MHRFLQTTGSVVFCTFVGLTSCRAAEPPKEMKPESIEDFFKSLPANARPRDKEDAFAIDRANDWILKNAPGRFLVFHFDSCKTDLEVVNGKGRVDITFLTSIPEKARFGIDLDKLHTSNGQYFVTNSVYVTSGNRKCEIRVRAPRWAGPNEPAIPGVRVDKLDEKAAKLVMSYSGKPVVYGGKVKSAFYNGFWDFFSIEIDVTTAIWVDPWDKR